MRKRLRKKKRMGEFAEYGFLLEMTPSESLTSNSRDALMDRFIDEAIERNGLSCGGGGAATWEFIVSGDARRASVTEGQRLSVAQWLDRQRDITAYSVGPPVDLWHGKF